MVPKHAWQVVRLAVALALLTAGQFRAQSPPTPHPSLPSFEVASIKPNRSGDFRTMIMFRPGGLHLTGATLMMLMAYAYNVKEFQITGGPSWMGSDRYDVEAKEEDAAAEQARKLPQEQLAEHNQTMVQSLLAERCKLQVTHQTKELPCYALVLAKNGPKFHQANPAVSYPNGLKGPDGKAHPGMARLGFGQLTGQGFTMASLANILSRQLGRTVIDQTRLKGNYDIELKWAPDQTPGMARGIPDGKPADPAPPPDTSGPSIFAALQEQLGLKLESTKGPVEIIVVHHIERPSED